MSEHRPEHSVDATKLMELVEAKHKLNEEIATASLTLAKLDKEISATCPHAMTTKKTSYASGGYDYPSESKTWDECTICGKAFNLVRKVGNFE